MATRPTEISQRSTLQLSKLKEENKQLRQQIKELKAYIDQQETKAQMKLRHQADLERRLAFMTALAEKAKSHESN